MTITLTHYLTVAAILFISIRAARSARQHKEWMKARDAEVVQRTAAKGWRFENGLGEVVPSFQGRPCWAGARSFTLDAEGHAWRCYPARRFRAQYLGNMLDGSFRLARGPSACLYAYCNCTVPIERRMMPR